MKNFAGIGAMGMLLLSFLPLAAPQTRGPLPKVVSASVPFYPPLAPPTRIQGVVTLQLSTDGKRVSAIDVESGPPMLAQAAKENVKTWEFEPHAPASFKVTFHYKLLPTICDSQCNCDSEEKESVVLQLPGKVEVSAKEYTICDPRAPIAGRNRSKRK
ncbi:MAG: energy transducer TonB [Acidobacteriia bacterium]|nr:energy transducer TonB [Terriglobia bacterium]